jgi:uncharacterized iron-regulated membrane protein
MNYKKLNRKIHYWGALACALPIAVVIVTGTLLLLKKEFEWIQPSSVKTSVGEPNINLQQIIPILNSHPELDISEWHQIKRIDVRPGKGILKAHLEGNWEVQMSLGSGEILKVAYRRSDLIESIHDGSFFHDSAKLGIFLPAAIILLILWITGIYLFAITELAKHRSTKKMRLSNRSRNTALNSKKTQPN